MNAQKVTETIVAQGILPLYFHEDEEITLDVLKAIYKAGIKAVEYTNRGDAALHNFGKMLALRNAEMPDLLLGIGTIKNVAQAQIFLDQGADFFISPGFVPEVATFLLSQDKFYSPGCMTPSEIIASENAGVTFIKLFPGNILGVDFLSSIKDIFPKLKFMPTGGVDTSRASIESWYKAGVSAVGMGSKLISKKLMSDRDYKTIEMETKKVLDIIKTIRQM